MHMQMHNTWRRWLAWGLWALAAGIATAAAAAPLAPSPEPVASPGTLTVQVIGRGAVIAADHFSCSGERCVTPIAPHTVLQMTASAANGWRFAGWEGDCNRRVPDCTLTMAGAPTVTARFVPDTFPTGCAMPPGQAGATPVVASGHPRVLLNHAPTVACLKSLMRARDPSWWRFRDFVNDEMAGGVDKPGQFNFEAWHAALIWQLTGYPEYRDFAIARVDAAVRAEEARIAAGQPAGVAFDSYLYVGGTVGNTALVYDWCFEALSPTQRARWIAYMNQAVHNVWHPKDARWGDKPSPWTGWATDNPFNNYHYSFLQATMLAGLATSGENPQAATWLNTFREQRVGRALLPAFNSQLSGGGSLEGSNYGVSLKTLFMLYDWWARSTGERLADLTPHTLGSLAWMLHQVVPTGEWLVSWGDQSRDHNAPFFDYNRDYLLKLIALYPQERLSAAASVLLRDSRLPVMHHGFSSVWDFLYKPPPLSEARITDLPTTWYAPGTGHLFMRAAWGDPRAAFAAFPCGMQAESHQHFEQASFQIFRGEWLAPSGNRFSRNGLEAGVDSKNLAWFKDPVTGRPVQQADPKGASGHCQMRALSDQPLYTYALAQLTPLYRAHPLVARQDRAFVFIKPATFVVLDRMTASSAKVPRVWSLQLSQLPTDIRGDHLVFEGPQGNRLDVHRVAPAGLRYELKPQAWAATNQDTGQYPGARRVDVSDEGGGSATTVFLHVLGTTAAGGAPSVRAVTPVNAPGQSGVRIELADGRVATLRFDHVGSGGHIALLAADGSVLSAGPLADTVTVPPLTRR